MPRRKTILANGEYYHVFNRGVASIPIFKNQASYRRFINLIDYLQYGNTPTSFSNFLKLSIADRQDIMTKLQIENRQLIEIISFCLMPNHYHFVLLQKVDKGISKFIANLQNSYGKYFNLRFNRAGPLVQPSFKAVRIETNEQLLHVTRYIHLNPITSFLVNEIEFLSYEWSSLPEYITNIKRYSFVNTDIVLDILDSEQYKEFVFDQINYQQELHKIRHLMLE